ncbi:bifunctional hydroxymethylpyrimidine kinase/phosphomethylpyrimidine kinase [Methanonatronarchaeum sp. AMET-Sl]|uniref:bifunctional hydroxymethylpyrimidine kinase/phosphomethylpyrimidine kinase n=1 Tax=Methanonatronarchaeum sp. AMET-Sl TaxID=3037654 RepID=UPI00244E232A|nr:bifunctional hydroxymethylpyrimidine kinase/phosphomethylpyrimidine kinase [Methanonatronarchaeum sp. AMET-Sl]WGI17927.1 bifunctional hydroxymethylpyrimidine kinase/phosphomethylpyrimidine kinase [Methanonatronarchaeum sp. AMET-Sl]
MKVPSVMTIAGSDSGGGAGIQADLKTFAALGVHGCSTITSVTSQNTETVTNIHDLPPENIKTQIETVLNDIDIKAIKIGMLHNEAIVKTVYNTLKNRDIYIVLDPVMISEGGDPLVTEGSLRTIKTLMLEISDLITPNKEEAIELSGKEIKTKKDIHNALEKIWNKGPETIVITGGHINGDDYVYNGKKHHTYKGSLLDIQSHGSGCTFSSAITAYIAKGNKPKKAIKKAKKFTTQAIKNGDKIGQGNIPVNPITETLKQSTKYKTQKTHSKALKKYIKANPTNLIPEVGSNIGMATKNPQGPEDIIAIPGRIVKTENKVKPVGCPKYGASSHVARIITTVMKHNPRIRGALNIKYSKEIIDIANEIGMKTTSFKRKNVPEDDTMSHGTDKAIKKHKSIPDLIYDTGGHGKEPMIRILGHDAVEAVSKAIKISKKHNER